MGSKAHLVSLNRTDMTITSRRVPNTAVPFQAFISSFLELLQSGEPNRATVLGILPEELAALEAFGAQWALVYGKYADEKGSRTSIVIEEVRQIIKGFQSYDQEHNILTRISASPYVTVTDLEICNIHSTLLRKSRALKLSKAIDVNVFPELNPVGRGVFQVRCHNSADERIAILYEATGIEYCYQVGGDAPASADAVLMPTSFSKKARFEIHLPDSHAGQTLFLFARWVNESYPQFSGPWSSLIQSIIL